MLSELSPDSSENRAGHAKWSLKFAKQKAYHVLDTFSFRQDTDALLEVNFGYSSSRVEQQYSANTTTILTCSLHSKVSIS